MIGALLNALMFGITPVCAGRAIRLIGFVRANLLRLLIAFIVMGTWAFIAGQGLKGQVGLLFLAGAVGFGIGGLTLLAALPRLGAPLTSLIEESGAAPVAALIAWVWYADTLRNDQILWCAVVLAGVVVGLAPYIRERVHGKGVLLGIGLAVTAAVARGSASQPPRGDPVVQGRSSTLRRSHGGVPAPGRRPAGGRGRLPGRQDRLAAALGLRRARRRDPGSH